ncbi:MAG: Ig-like domain-containing protein [Desulfuromonadales bacterium]|nr:Ig-like domain-containing protein [Desulfuromonadales bacterium]
MGRRILWLLALAGTLWLPGCGSDNKDVGEELQIDRKGFTAYFDLTAKILPFPSNLLFSGSTDGTLNIPVANPADFSDPKVAMNALDGFSTIAPISTTFSSAIDPSTLTTANVRVFEVTLSGIGGAVTGISRELAFGSEFVATLSTVDPTNSTLVILPIKPLKSQTSYLLMLSNGIKGADGQDPQTSAHYLIAKTPNSLVGTPAATLEPVRQLVNYQEAALAGQEIDKSTIILSWTFTTQSTGNVLSAVRTAATGTATVNPSPVRTTADLLGAGPGIANVYVGQLTLPYYLTNASASPMDPLTTFWQGVSGSNLTFLNPTPVAKSTEAIPLLVSLPNANSGRTKPTTGWKVAIYQHGITTNRTTMLAIADSMASAGFAVVAIDLPLHGLAPGHPLRSPGERTFDLDLVNNTTGAPGADGFADSSGTHFINLASLLTSRDNARQGIADLFALTKSLSTIDVDGDSLADFDSSEMYFIGHSLGGILGSVFLAQEPTVKAAVLGMPGGGIAKLLDGSASFGPKIAAGLATKGVIKGTAAYESFLGATQTVIDSADPINYTAATVTGRGVLLFEVVGDGAGALPDQVVPNNVMAKAPVGTVRAPLAGTDPLAAFMGLTPISSTTSNSSLKAWLRFTAGDHASILSPAASPAVTTVMQGAMATFLATNGATVAIADTTVVQ